MLGMALGIRSSAHNEANADKNLVFGIHPLATDFRDERVAVPPQSLVTSFMCSEDRVLGLGLRAY